MAGRKTKLTPLVQEKMVQAIRAGNYAGVAARYAGIDESTLYRWLEKGEREGGGAYCEFRKAIKDAEAIAEIQAVAEVRAAARESWQAAMTWLERKHPERWGRRDRIQQTNFNVDVDSLTDEQLKRIAAGEDPAAVISNAERSR